MVVFTGGLATRLGQMLGVDPTGTVVWNILKWFALAAVVAGMLAVLYRTAPTVRRPNFRGVTPGIAVAVILWLIASALFALYLAKFGSYNQTYGSIAGVIIFLLWLWVINNIILLGVQFDIDMRRTRVLETAESPAGQPGAGRTEEPKVEPGRVRASSEGSSRVEREKPGRGGRIYPS
jgi:membrane protein